MKGTMGPEPPRWAEHLARMLLPADHHDTRLGDLRELHADVWEAEGRGPARRWYLMQVARLAPFGLFNLLTWTFIMLHHWLTTALRSVRRQTVYSLIHLTGLAAGMACFVLIALFVLHEYSVDRWHEDDEHLYRTIRSASNAEGDVQWYSSMPYALGDLLETSFPHVDGVVRIMTQNQIIVQRTEDDTTPFHETSVLLVEPSFFDVFSFNLVHGSPSTVLANPDGLVITESLEEKYFGAGNGLGQVLRINHDYSGTVTGIVEDPPSNSSIQFPLLAHIDAPWGVRERFKQLRRDEWSQQMYTTYVRTTASIDTEEMSAAITDALSRVVPEQSRRILTTRSGEPTAFRIEPMSDTYLVSPSTSLVGPVGNPTLVRVFGTAALLVLLLAALNYVNLATARAARRAREIGVRLASGSRRFHIRGQFITEACVIALLACPLGLLGVHAALPWFNDVLGHDPGAGLALSAPLVAGMVLFAIVLGTTAGVWPAVVMARMKPVNALKGQAGGTGQGVWFRRGMVVLQFTVSTVLIAGTLTIQRQLDHLRETGLGLSPDQVLVIPMFQTPVQAQAGTFKTALRSESPVESVSLSNLVPGRGAIGMVQFGGSDDGDVKVKRMDVDADFLTTFDIPLLAGEALSTLPASSDERVPVLLNETAARELEATYEGPVLGGDFRLAGLDVRITGIVEDFVVTSRHEPIEAAMLVSMGSTPVSASYASVKLAAANADEALDALSRTWFDIAPDHPFDYFFVDDAFDAMYRTEDRMARIFRAFSFLAIGIACLGLYGLASWTAEQRRREVGIRKVLGATSSGLTALLSREFMILVLSGLAIALPVAGALGHWWLSNFPYQAGIPVSLYLTTGLLTLLTAMFTVVHQTWRAANTNPAVVLRHD